MLFPSQQKVAVIEKATINLNHNREHLQEVQYTLQMVSELRSKQFNTGKAEIEEGKKRGFANNFLIKILNES